MTITEFLLARIADDEALVLERWDSDGVARVASVWTGPEPGYTTVASDSGDGVWVADGHEIEDVRHVTVLFDPARVLAECEAKRRTVNMLLARDEDEHPAIAAHATGLRLAVKAMALVYADHPDFDPAWEIDQPA